MSDTGEDMSIATGTMEKGKYYVVQYKQEYGEGEKKFKFIFIGQTQVHAMARLVKELPNAEQAAKDKAAFACDNIGYGAFKGATSSTDGGSGLVPTPKAANAGQYLKGDGTWGTPTNTTYNDATQSAHGLMTAADKTKLDSIAAGANKYVHPSYTAAAAGLYKVTVDASGHVSAATAVEKSDITALGIPSTNTTYSAATQSANGLMSAADKKKLDGFGAASSYATRTYVGQQISAAGHISKSIVQTLPAVKDAKDNVIYMIKKAAPDGSNLYDEYMLISGALEKIGDTKTVIDEITNEEIDTILAS